MWLALAGLPAAASAQYIGGRAPEPPPAPAAGSLESPEAALARNVRLLAINPKNYDALLGAGRAALRLGDAQAAVGFFGRAEEVNSAHWAPKAGQGSALAHMGEATAALGMFEQAQRLGATHGLVALDRGLAFDLLGRQSEAQADYRAVGTGIDRPEAQRRLALSLAISGRKAEALAALDPLLAMRDNGARRTRALILALGGDLDGARQAIGALMPGAASGFDPFLRRLATLGPGQKAAAVHLGILPAEGAVLAALEPPTPRSSPPISTPVRIAAATPPSTPAEPRPNASRLADIESSLVRIPATAAPPPAPRPLVERAPRRTTAGERSLASRPPSEPPPVERTAARKSRDNAATTSARRKADEEKPTRTAARSAGSEANATRGGKVTEEKPARTPARTNGREAMASRGGKAEEERPERPSTSSRIYVQLAGGANADRMGREFARLRTGRNALFRGRTPLVSEVRGWARLLVGPFKDGETAQEFVNDLRQAKVEAFVWTAPAGTKFDKLDLK